MEQGCLFPEFSLPDLIEYSRREGESRIECKRRLFGLLYSAPLDQLRKELILSNEDISFLRPHQRP
jgi:hypothetical protein